MMSPHCRCCCLSVGLVLLVLSLLVTSGSCVRCFECFDSSLACTTASNCTGSACILYENMPNRTWTAFCLLAGPVAERQDSAGMGQGCWRDEASGGVECVCTSHFCNAPRDQWSSDPNTPPVAGLKMLERNPFVDYEYLDEESAIGATEAQHQQQRHRDPPQPTDTPQNKEDEPVDPLERNLNALHDPELAADDLKEQQDLMPVEFAEYLDWERRVRFRNSSTLPSSTAASPSASTESPPPQQRTTIGQQQNDDAQSDSIGSSSPGNETNPLLLGNSAAGDRPWLLALLAITVVAFSPIYCFV